jgi:DNA-directed RNA polymerase subunit K/omega
MSAASASMPHALLLDQSGTNTMGNRFLLAVIAFQRSKQLQGGATARIARDGHKPTLIAVLEVLDNRISWSREDPPPAGDSKSSATDRI